MTMKIGELAQAAQTQVETIGCCEREGLLSQAPRSEEFSRSADVLSRSKLATCERLLSQSLTFSAA